jgi:parallel beta-helix repeat protein
LDVTEDVKKFVDGTYNNYGWVIDDTVSDSDATTVFYSKEGTSNSNLKPRLEIEGTPSVVYIDDDYDSGTAGWGFNHFDNIQDGIDAVEEGGTVHVYSGTYYENVVVNKVVDLTGADKTTTIIDGGGTGDVIHISTDGVTVSSFTIQNSGFVGWQNDYDAGIDIRSNNNIITDNIIQGGCIQGMYLRGSSNNHIYNNEVKDNYAGILIMHSSDSNIVSDNIVLDNTMLGIWIYDAYYNSIYHNNLIDNPQNAGGDNSANTWYSSALHEGNYWSDYTGTDDDCDGIGNTPYDVPNGSNQDLYPFMSQDGWNNIPPVADAGGPYYANVNNAITFDGSGSSDTDGTIEKYRWDFTNDGTYDTSWLTTETTTHSYSSSGTYTVKLQVKDDDSVCDTNTATATISPADDTSIPTADANGPYSGYVNYSIIFSSHGSIGGAEGTILSWYWTFGDGTVSSQQNPTHKYTTSGTYTVTLKVTNNYGKTNTDTTTATINELSPDQTPPVADAGGPYSGVVGSPIMFDGSDSNDSDGTIASYTWDFGDGTTGTGITPTHTYTTAGNYTVVLTVTDNNSLTHSNSITASINVSGPPTILIAIDISNIEPIEEENEKTIPVTVFCYHQLVSNIHLEILESSNLTVTLLSPNITLNPGESRELLIKIRAPKLEEANNSENKVSDETITLRAVGDGNITSNTEQINLKVVEKNATPGFEAIAAITAVGTAGALTAFFRRRNGIR